MNLFSGIITAISLWFRYGGAAEKAMIIVQDIDAIDGGGLFAKIDAVLKKDGVDLSAMLMAASGAPDLTTIEGIQVALNKANLAIAITPTGQLDSATIQSVSAFQKMAGLKIDGIPGPATVATLLEYMKKG